MDIKYVKDSAGNNFFPLVHERGVVDDNGTTLESKLQSKQDAISDLATIRSGAAAGATAVQPATTLAGYGITDGYTKTEGQALENTVDNRLDDQDAAIALLNGSEVIVVADHTQVASPNSQKIYREQGSTSYTDWMYQDSTWKEIATYNFPGIDDEPTAGSDNLVKSGGVFENLTELRGIYVENPEFVRVITDNEDKILYGVKSNGEFYFGAGCPPQVKDYVQTQIDILMGQGDITEKIDTINEMIAFFEGIRHDETLQNLLQVSADSIAAEKARAEAIEEALSTNKVDKEEGKSLIDADYASSQSAIDSPEYLQVTTDSEDKVIEGIRNDGTKVIGVDVEIGGSATINGHVTVLGNVAMNGLSYNLVESPEWVRAVVDAEDKVLCGIKTDGKFYADIAGIPSEAAILINKLQEQLNNVSADITNLNSRIVIFEQIFSIVQNPEFIDLEVDAADKILGGRDADGNKFENLNLTVKGDISTKKSFEVNGTKIENIEDPENRIEIKTDSDDKIISYRDSEGILHEEAGLKLSKQALSAFEQDLIDDGFSPGSSDNPIKNNDLVRIFDNDNLSVYRNNNSRVLVAGFRDIVVWANTSSLAISTDGFDGEQTVVNFNSTNFPNLIPGSRIERVLLTPWTRNATNSYSGQDWRMNVITNHAQIYHNFPSRAIDSDGTALNGDAFRFDESVVWELPERWSPVRTTTGDDATLITTGKYKYFPGLNTSAYTFHPAINQDNGYGNGGFPAYIEKENELGQTIGFSRFTQYRMDDNQDNSFAFMAGVSAHPKLTLLGTYRSNSTKETRICVFMTNDGGRQWFCRYEFGAPGFRIDGNDNRVGDITFQADANPLVITENFSSPASGAFSIRARYQYTPSADFKEIELTKKFKWLEPVEVQSITKDGSNHVIVECADHNLNDGEVIIFTKNDSTATDWDWMVNEGFGVLSCGNGVIFRAKVIDSSHIELRVNFSNPHNNLAVRHIHSINRCKDGYTIGTGEQYPAGWIFYLSVWQSDSYVRKYPWDTMDFIRLNSTRTSVQRPLGVVLSQDEDTTVTVGIDNEATSIDDSELPEGRSESVRRSSNGLWRGKLVDFDDQSKFNCIFPSDEVCYFYKNLLGVDVYIGQQGHIGVSADGGNNWTETRTLNNESVLGGRIPSGSTDVVNGGYIVIENYIIKSKV